MSLSKLLLIENSSADFYKARIPLYNYLQNKGYDVYALVPDDGFIEQIKEADVKVITYPFNRKDKGIVQLVRLLFLYHKIIREHRFDIVHSFRFLPNLLNTLVNFFNSRKVVLHITGLGIAFSNYSLKYYALRIVSQLLFLVKMLRAQTVIVQNEDDVQDIWLARRFKNVKVIPGSGVDTQYFSVKGYNAKALRSTYGVQDSDLVFVCVTRLLWEKGIREMVEAFEQLHASLPSAKLWIVGWSDQDNPRHVDEAFIQSYDQHPFIKFWGRQKDVRSLLVASDVFLFPSYYREGIPRGVMEAMSMEMPIITTTMPGCKLTVNEGVNGYLIEPRSVDAIVRAVQKMQAEPRRQQMGQESRLMAEKLFSDHLIFSQIEALYNPTPLMGALDHQEPRVSSIKVTIVTVVRNNCKLLPDAIESVLAQSYPHIEYIVIDGGSDDGSLEVIQSYGNRIHGVVSEPDKGIYDAMNKGLAMATGDVIGFLNSDDFYADQDAVANVVSLFEQQTTDAVYADLDYVDLNHKDKIVRKWRSGNYSSNRFFNGWMPPHPTVFIRSEVYKRCGGFNTKLKSAADYELMLRMAMVHKVKFAYVNKVLVKMRLGGQSNRSFQNRLKANLEDRKAWEINKLKPRWYTLLLKPLLKIPQYFTA